MSDNRRHGRVPDPDSYSRVTDPERFAPLHHVALDMIDDLQRRFQVAVESVEPDPRHLRGGALAATRLTPTNAGAPVTITLTGFPGVLVRFGAAHSEPFPSCGCDACDEQLDEVVEDLHRKLDAVARGRFSEPPGGHDFVFDDGATSGASPLPRFRRKAPHRRYEPWPLRTSG